MFEIIDGEKVPKFDDDTKKIVASIQKQFLEEGLKNIGDSEAYQKLKKTSKNFKKNLILKLVEYTYSLEKVRNEDFLTPHTGKYNYLANYIFSTIINNFLRSKLDYNEDEWVLLFSTFDQIFEESILLGYSINTLSAVPMASAVKQLEYFRESAQLSKSTLLYIEHLLSRSWIDNSKKYSYKLRALIEEENEHYVYEAPDIADEVNIVINQIVENKLEYKKLFELVSEVSGGKPKDKFENLSNELIRKIGPNNYKKVVHGILDIVAKRKPTDQYNCVNNYWVVDYYLSSPSKIFIKGIIWTCTRFSDKQTIQLLSAICEKAYSKIKGRGPAAAILGNACIYTLGHMRGKEGLGALSRLRLKVGQKNFKNVIDKYLLQGAKKYNLSIDELKEIAVPDFSMHDGSKRVIFEKYVLEISIKNSRVIQQWLKPDGTCLKSVPSIVKNSALNKKKLKSIRKEVREIQKVYSSQRQRIDNQFILKRTWDFEVFEKYYLKHGLVAHIAKRLIWTFTINGNSIHVIYQKNRWIDVNDNIIAPIDSHTTVQLWHPINATEQEIILWRQKLMNLGWKQPIKQAFREIYIVTDAEIATGNYSNRMTAHILKQHQFNALTSIRDWKYALMGAYDDGIRNTICSKDLDEYSIKAEFWIDEVNQDDLKNDKGIWLYITTDQVKFLNTDDDDTIDLVDLPQIVFSEIMRDIDLFVGVTSIGNDPSWVDNNGARQLITENQHFQRDTNYWRDYSFGELSQIAKTRKLVLEQLLSQIKKLHDISRIENNFLIVEGKLRTYKIHIGSGNILMEPNNQYLCIVPTHSSPAITRNLFIPFEGDNVLTIILSKALLLAEDHKITDPVIIQQIERSDV